MFDRFTVLPVNRFPNKLAPNVPSKNCLETYFFCSFVLFLIVIGKTDSSRGLIIFVISFISLFEIINVVMPDPKTFFRIAASIADATAINPNDIKTILANDLSTFFI